MGISDAKKLIGKTCAVHWLDRTGSELSTVSKIHDVTFVPLYGGYIIADTEDIRLDKVTSILVMAEDGSATTVFNAQGQEAPVAA